MTDSADTGPLDSWSNDIGLSAAADADLIGEGWVRRHFVEPARVQESIELYASMGFEVRTRKPEASEFGSQCQECASAACGSYLLVYTRKKKGENSANASC